MLAFANWRVSWYSIIKSWAAGGAGGKSEDLHSFYNLREHRSDQPLSFSRDRNDFDFVYDVEK